MTTLEESAEIQRLKETILTHKRIVESFSYQAHPLREELAKLDEKIQFSLSQITRAELQVARLEERIDFLPEGLSARKPRTSEEKILELLSQLPKNKRDEVLELLKAGLGGGVDNANHFADRFFSDGSGGVDKP